MLHPLRFCYRLMKRLCVWAYQPTTEEKLRTAFRLGRAAERNELLQLPITKSQQQTGPIVQIPESLQWPNMAWSRYYYEMHPDLYTSRTPLRSRKTVHLVPDSPTTDPITMSRLDTQPGIVEATVKVRAVEMQERHPKRE